MTCNLLAGGEITTEIERIDTVDTDRVHTQEPNLNIDQGHGLVHGPKGKAFCYGTVRDGS